MAQHGQAVGFLILAANTLQRYMLAFCHVRDACLLEVVTNTVVMATVGGSSWHIIEAERWQIPFEGVYPLQK